MNPLISRYRGLKFYWRISILACLAAVPAYLYYTNFVEAKNTQVETLEKDMLALNAKIAAAQKKLTLLKNLESQEKTLQEQLTIAKASIPDKYDIETLLLRLSNVAQETGVSVKLFEPKKEQMIEAAYPYHEYQVDIQASGSYEQIGNFFDRILSLKPTVALRETLIERDVADLNLRMEQNRVKNLTVSDQQKAVRRYLKLIAKTQIAVFRSLSPEEMNAWEAKRKAADPNKKAAAPQPAAQQPKGAPT